MLLMSFLPISCALLLHFPLFRTLITPLLLIVKTSRVRARSRADTIVDDSDWTLTSTELRALPLSGWCVRCLIRASCIDDPVSQVGPMLLELVSDAANHVIVTELTICLEFTQVDQLG